MQQIDLPCCYGDIKCCSSSAGTGGREPYKPRRYSGSPLPAAPVWPRLSCCNLSSDSEEDQNIRPTSSAVKLSTLPSSMWILEFWQRNGCWSLFLAMRIFDKQILLDNLESYALPKGCIPLFFLVVHEIVDGHLQQSGCNGSHTSGAILRLAKLPSAVAISMFPR